MSGEINIDDIKLFYPSGRMSKVWLMWETVRRFAKLLDDAHVKQMLSLENILKKYEGSEILPEDKIHDQGKRVKITGRIEMYKGKPEFGSMPHLNCRSSKPIFSIDTRSSDLGLKN